MNRSNETQGGQDKQTGVVTLAGYVAGRRAVGLYPLDGIRNPALPVGNLTDEQLAQMSEGVNAALEGVVVTTRELPGLDRQLEVLAGIIKDPTSNTPPLWNTETAAVPRSALL